MFTFWAICVILIAYKTSTTVQKLAEKFCTALELLDGTNLLTGSLGDISKSEDFSECFSLYDLQGWLLLKHAFFCK